MKKRWPDFVIAFGLGMILGMAISIKSNVRLRGEARKQLLSETGLCDYTATTVTVGRTPPSAVPGPRSGR